MSPNGLTCQDVRNFHVVLQEERKMAAALIPTTIKAFEEVERPKWSRETLIKFMAMLTKGDGILDYGEVCSKFGKDVGTFHDSI